MYGVKTLLQQLIYYTKNTPGVMEWPVYYETQNISDIVPDEEYKRVMFISQSTRYLTVGALMYNLELIIKTRNKAGLWRLAFVDDMDHAEPITYLMIDMEHGCIILSHEK